MIMNSFSVGDIVYYKELEQSYINDFTNDVEYIPSLSPNKGYKVMSYSSLFILHLTDDCGNSGFFPDLWFMSENEYLVINRNLVINEILE